MTVVTSDNRYGVAKFIVAPTIAQGANYTTIAAALTAASSGDTIFIRPGTYTENLTLKAGVNLCAFSGDELTPNVTIVGKATFTTAGTVTVSNIRLTTNSDFLVVVSGSAASVLKLNSCYINCLNNTGISHTSSDGGSQISLVGCSGNIATTLITLFISTSAGGIDFLDTTIGNTGSSVTTSSISTGICILRRSSLSLPLTTSSAGSIDADFSSVKGQNNSTPITTAGTGSSSFHNCYLSAGSASAVSIGVGTQVSMSNCDFDSSNTNVISGAGTLVATSLSFYGTSSVINPTTVTGRYTNLVQYKSTVQPSFLSYNSASINTVTGDGTNYTVIWDAEIFDQNSNFNTGTGTFTAPVTGRYLLTSQILMNDMGVLFTGSNIALIASNRNTTFNRGVASAGAQQAIMVTNIVDMDAADTCSVLFNVSGSTKTIDVQQGSSTDLRCFFSGQLIA